MSTAERASYLSRELQVSMPPEQIAERVIPQMRARYRMRMRLMPEAAQASGGWRRGGHWGWPRRHHPRWLTMCGTALICTGCFAVTLSTETVARGKPT